MCCWCCCFCCCSVWVLSSFLAWIHCTAYSADDLFPPIYLLFGHKWWNTKFAHYKYYYMACLRARARTQLFSRLRKRSKQFQHHHQQQLQQQQLPCKRTHQTPHTCTLISKFADWLKIVCSVDCMYIPHPPPLPFHILATIFLSYHSNAVHVNYCCYCRCNYARQ